MKGKRHTPEQIVGKLRRILEELNALDAMEIEVASL
jgi:hypothetical protein